MPLSHFIYNEFLINISVPVEAARRRAGAAPDGARCGGAVPPGDPVGGGPVGGQSAAGGGARGRGGAAQDGVHGGRAEAPDHAHGIKLLTRRNISKYLKVPFFPNQNCWNLEYFLVHFVNLNHSTVVLDFIVGRNARRRL